MVAGQETRHRKSEAPPGHGTGTMAFPLSEHTPLVQWEVEKVLWEVVREVVWEVVWEVVQEVLLPTGGGAGGGA